MQESKHVTGRSRVDSQTQQCWSVTTCIAARHTRARQQQRRCKVTTIHALLNFHTTDYAKTTKQWWAQKNANNASMKITATTLFDNQLITAHAPLLLIFPRLSLTGSASLTRLFGPLRFVPRSALNAQPFIRLLPNSLYFTQQQGLLSSCSFQFLLKRFYSFSLCARLNW